MSFRDRFLALQEASKCQDKKIDKKVTEEDSDIKCPECGAMNPMDAEKCKECGAEIKTDKEEDSDDVSEADIVKMLDKKELADFKPAFSNLAKALSEVSTVITTHIVLEKTLKKDFDVIYKAFTKFDKSWNLSNDLVL